MYFKIKIFCLSCLFLSVIVFSSCGDVNDINDVGKNNCPKVIDNEVKIKDIKFIKIIGFTLYLGEIWLTPSSAPVDNYKFGDTMAIRCEVINPVWNIDGNRNRPIEPPIVAKITSSQTGDVQYITFEFYLPYLRKGSAQHRYKLNMQIALLQAHQ